MKKYMYFGIDCEPGMPRPNEYAEVIFNHFNQEYVEPISKLFGAWEWDDVLQIDEEGYQWLKEYLRSLYPSKIRGAIWGNWESAKLVEE